MFIEPQRSWLCCNTPRSYDTLLSGRFSSTSLVKSPNLKKSTPHALFYYGENKKRQSGLKLGDGAGVYIFTARGLMGVPGHVQNKPSGTYGTGSDDTCSTR